MWIVQTVFWVMVGLLSVPVAVLCAECVLSLLPGPRRGRGPGRRPRAAVLIAAHNEEADLAQTLACLRPQLTGEDRLLVVADNCDDATARIARRGGAEVCERFDAKRRGKGYALDYGLCHLALDPPEVVVMVDADCTVQAGAVEQLVRQVAATGRPAQALYLMDEPPTPSPRDLASALAFMVKNRVRPAGLHRAGLPCLLTGSGMAFPWHVICRARLATGNLVEDMQLGLDLALSGAAPAYCGQARVTGRLPASGAAAKTQRTRWEQGHMRTLLRQGPRLLSAGLRQRRLGVVALALDLCVPPLSMLVMAWAGTALAASAASLAGASWWPALVLWGQGLLMTGALLAAWVKYAPPSLPLSTFLAAPLYLLWKVPLYAGLLLRPQTAWVRTQRDAPGRV